MPICVSGADDEFAAYDFSEFTEEDFARIDADIAKKEDLAKVTVAYETVSSQISLHRPSQSKRSWARLSPLEAFRQYGPLYVTDLASPSWCEVQFEYGLRGKRSRPPRERPTSFRSASGKEIKIDGVVAAQNDVITSKGKVIHKSLEREVKPKEVVVEVSGTEERWALRLSNMLSCLKGMRLEGFTREMPVFGIEDGEIIVGVIDELVYQPKDMSTEEYPKAIDLTQTRIKNHGGNINPENAIPNEPSFKLQIIDTKTRKRPSLPLEEDTLPSRLQLMLYHRLLSGLVSPEPSFDFVIFWQLANVDPEQQLSWRFLEQAGLIADEGEFQVYNLNDLSVLWHDLVHQLRITGVDNELKLIYRLQIHGERKKGRLDAFATQNVSKVAKASGSSRDSLSWPAAVASTEIVSLLDSSAGDMSSPGHSTTFVEKASEMSTRVVIDRNIAGEKHQIIGTKVLNYDSEFLSSHLADILAWWRGERKPKGVPVELARRCVTCEYRADCEWREERAKEFQEQAASERETSIIVVE